MTRLDQSVNARMREIHSLVRSGATEMTGRAIRESGSGKIVGRHGGGMTDMYPELHRAGMSPGEAAAAVERGKGKVYERLRHSIRAELIASGEFTERKRYAEKPTVPPHKAITRRCKVCTVEHGKGEHRAHGKGAYHRTHLFSFGENPPKSTRTKRSKSQKNLVLIYGRVLRIEAQKTGPHHCDAECRRCQHKYVHDFKISPKMIGLNPGDVIEVPAGMWPILIYA